MPPNLKKNNNNNPQSPTTNVKYKYNISLPEIVVFHTENSIKTNNT